jgi:hypothetical protein
LLRLLDDSLRLPDDGLWLLNGRRDRRIETRRRREHRLGPGNEALRNRIVEPQHNEYQKSDRLRPDYPGNPVPTIVVPKPSVRRDPRGVRIHGLASLAKRIINGALVIVVAKLKRL